MRHAIAATALLLFTLSTNAQLVPKDAVPEKVADGYKFTEGPALGPDGCIYFTDIPASLILRFDPETNQTTTFREDTDRSNGLMWHNGNLYACSHGARAVRYYHINEELPKIKKRAGPGELKKQPETPDKPRAIVSHWHVDIDADKRITYARLNSPNDLAIDRDGNFYFTDPRYGNRDDLELPFEGVYYSGTFIKKIDGRDVTMSHSKEIDKSLERPNGIVLSPDESILYVADHGANWIYTYDTGSDNIFKTRRKFAQINNGEGKGSDGMTVDAKGRLYATGHSKVWVFEPSGQLVATIPVGKQTTNCTFGADGKTLYITANKGLYRMTLNTDAPLEHAEKE